MEYSNWRSLARLYAIVQLDRDAPKRTTSDEEVTITIGSSELVHNIVLGVASVLLFGTLSQSDEKLVRFAFSVPRESFVQVLWCYIEAKQDVPNV